MSIPFFSTKEFVPPEIYKMFGENSLMFIDSRVVKSVISLRNHFGRPIIINTWHSGGKLSQRGFRVVPVQANYSQHLYGRAIDFNVVGLSDAEVQAEIIKNYSSLNLDITRIEKNTVGWTHIDCAFTGIGELVVFNG